MAWHSTARLATHTFQRQPTHYSFIIVRGGAAPRLGTTRHAALYARLGVVALSREEFYEQIFVRSTGKENATARVLSYFKIVCIDASS